MTPTTRRYLWTWLIGANLARLTVAMAPLAILLGLEPQRGYPAGGIVIFGLTIGEVLPLLLSRMIRHRGTSSRQLRLSIAGACLSMIGVGAGITLGLSTPTLTLLAVVAGCCGALSFGGIRALLTATIDPTKLEHALNRDSTLLELTWIIGPLLVTFARVVFGYRAASLALCPVAIVGALASLLLMKASQPLPPERPVTTGGASQQRASTRQEGLKIWIILGSSIEGGLEGFVIIAAPLLVTSAGGSLSLAGVLLGILSAGSISGGLLYGRLLRILESVTSRRRLGVLLGILGVLLVVVAQVHSLTARLGLIYLFGLFIAPTNTVRAVAVIESTPSSRHARGFSAIYAAYSIGYAFAALVFSQAVTIIGIDPVAVAIAVIGLTIAIFVLRSSGTLSLSKA